MLKEERFVAAVALTCFVALVSSAVYAIIIAINWDSVSTQGRVAIGAAVLGAASIVYAIAREDSWRAKRKSNN